MSKNPYATQYDGVPSGAKSQVRGPAISLIIVASIGLLLGFFGLAFDVLVLAGGFGQFVDPEGTPVRLIWGIMLLATSAIVLFGAIKMLKLESFGLAKTSAIIAVIPCIGPCIIFSIPFGIWALIVLGKPEVKNAFR